MCRRPASRRAFSLAELLLSLLIVALALLGLVSEQIYSVRAQSKVSLRHRAGVAAASRMADLQEQLLVDFAPRSVARQKIDEGLESAASVKAVEGLDNLLDVALSIYFTDGQGPQQLDLSTKVLKP